MTNSGKNFRPLPFASSKGSGRNFDEQGEARIFEKYAAEILKNSFSFVRISDSILHSLRYLHTSFGSVDPHTRANFSFLGRTDGFMPEGATFARDRDKTDLCRTFNYWYRYRDDHSRHSFSSTAFYRAAAECEVELHELASEILKQIAAHHCYQHPLQIRNDSYVQFNIYPEDMKSAGRKYLQDRHEDGHLLTVVKPNAPGLLIYSGDEEQLVNIEPNEAIVMAGSLLTELTDGDVRPLYHSVLDLNLPAERASLIYNVNVLNETMPSFKGRSIQMLSIANKHHTEFGQRPYHSN